MKTKPLNLSPFLGDYCHSIIGQYFHKIVSFEKDVFKNKDIEALHQMRVSMQNLNIAIQLFDMIIILPENVNKRSIRKIFECLGKTRDFDVLQLNLLNYDQSNIQKKENMALKVSLKSIHQNRNQCFNKLKKALNGQHYRELMKSIKEWIDNPAFNELGKLMTLEVLPELLSPFVCQLLLHPGWLAGTTIDKGKVILWPFENTEELREQILPFSDNLHNLRKHLKAVRYQTKFFSNYYESSSLEIFKEFKQIQEILGKLHDQFVLYQFLEFTLKEDLAKALPSINRQMQQELKILWQNWQPIQKCYLSPEFRHSLYLKLIFPKLDLQ